VRWRVSCLEFDHSQGYGKFPGSRLLPDHKFLEPKTYYLLVVTVLQKRAGHMIQCVLETLGPDTSILPIVEQPYNDRAMKGAFQMCVKIEVINSTSSRSRKT
jgi:hypothetical protein